MAPKFRGLELAAMYFSGLLPSSCHRPGLSKLGHGEKTAWGILVRARVVVEGLRERRIGHRWASYTPFHRRRASHSREWQPVGVALTFEGIEDSCVEDLET